MTLLLEAGGDQVIIEKAILSVLKVLKSFCTQINNKIVRNCHLKTGGEGKGKGKNISVIGL